MHFRQQGNADSRKLTCPENYERKMVNSQINKVIKPPKIKTISYGENLRALHC